MNQKISTWVGAIILIIISITAGVFVWKYYQLSQVSVDVSPIITKQKSKPTAGMANPASVYCEEHGGKLEIRTGADSGQAGFCKLADGSECEEWQYFRGECGQSNVNIEDWQTYRNEKYGFEFQYPPYLFNLIPKYQYNTNSGYSAIQFVDTDKKRVLLFIQINDGDNFKLDTLEEKEKYYENIDKESGGSSIKSINKINMDGASALKVEFSEDYGAAIYEVYFVKNNKSFFFTFNQDDRVIILPDVDRILSTFKFTN